jgi:hypothetical protein
VPVKSEIVRNHDDDQGVGVKRAFGDVVDQMDLGFESARADRRWVTSAHPCAVPTSKGPRTT